MVGTATAACVTVFDFRGRRTLEWALLLPLAMPAYVVAYAYTDFLQFSGPAQTWLRASFGLTGRVLPEVRSVGGAAWVFTFSLYPYVYLLARTALSERAAHLMEAARLLGAPLARRLHRGGVADGQAGDCRRHGPGADGDAGRLRRLQLLRHPDLHGRHLQGLAGHGQPHRRRAAGHHAAGRRGAAAGAGAKGPGAHALCHLTRAPGRWRRAARGAGRRAPLAGAGRVRPAGVDGLRAAGGVHAAPAGGRLVGAALGPFPAMDAQQRLAGRA